MPWFRAFRRLLHVALAAAGLFALAPADSSQAGQEVRQFDVRTGKWVRQRVDNNEIARRLNAAPIPPRIVAFAGKERERTIIVDTARRRLLLVRGDGTALEYMIGVGREGFAWKGREKVSRKAEWPSWTPPQEMIRREAVKGRILPATMEGGPENPLGARALYLGSTLYRIHGTNEPQTLGGAVSSGCIRMANDDIIDLYNKVRIGDSVLVR